MYRLLIFFSLLCISTFIYSQEGDFYYEDYVYVTNLKTVKFNPVGDPLEPPVAYINANQRLVLTFDDMDNDSKDYTYYLIHCDKNWNPSNINPIDYMDGFQNEEINSIQPSSNTFVPYTHYTLTLPNNDIRWTISGNYLLVVYEGRIGEDRYPVITRRFMVVDKNVNINVKKRRPLDVSKINTHQEFDLFVNYENYNIIDPQNNVYVTVLQNYRWDTAIKNLQPKFVVGYNLTIDNSGKISFPALKEFRPIDIRSLDLTAIGTQSVHLIKNGTIVTLDIGQNKTDRFYTNDPDANGMFVIQNRDTGNSKLQGDYARVLFTLKMPEIQDDVYIMGSFTDWQPDDMYRMSYDPATESYLGEVELKQGYYNYFYGVLEGNRLNARPIEGSWNETENQYQIFVYVRQPGDRYDKLIGYNTFNSNM